MLNMIHETLLEYANMDNNTNKKNRWISKRREQEENIKIKDAFFIKKQMMDNLWIKFKKEELEKRNRWIS